MTRATPKTYISAAIIAASLAVTGCAADGSNQNETLGTLLGAAAGAWAGSSIGSGDGQIIATAAGTMLGAAVGNKVGRSMDELDRIKAADAQRNAYSAPIGETIVWNNVDSGNYGNVTPVRDGYTDSGRYCREFQTEVTVDGEQQKGYGTACRQEDGSWQIVSQ
ncbi:MAG: RT0821/Lpp0805 family surface protein [Rhodospirillaceae bacterium]